MRRFWGGLSWIFALALLVYLLNYAVKSLDIVLLRSVLASPEVVASVAVAALLYTMIVPITAWAWKRLLIFQGEHRSVISLSLILGFSQLAKYVPGNIAQHVARAAMSLQAGIRVGPLLVTVAQEVLLATAASLIVGMAALALSGRNFTHVSPSVASSFPAISLALLILVAFLASMRFAPADLKSKEGPMWRMLAKLGGVPGPAVTLSALFAYSLNYFIIGVALWLVTRAMGIGDLLGFFLVTSVFSLSWVLGFLAPGAPAGLGAREGIMLILLHGSAANNELLVFVLLARLVTMLGDAISFLGATIGRFLVHRAGGSNG